MSDEERRSDGRRVAQSGGGDLDRRPSRARRWGLANAVLVLLSSAAHVTLGWPELRGELVAAATPSETIAQVSAGWFFGSVCMLVFVGTLVAGALDPLPSHRRLVPVYLIAVAYVAFGSVGFVLRGANAHYLGFVAIGLSVGGAGLATARLGRWDHAARRISGHISDGAG